MSEAVRLADYAIWAVALALYAFDAGRRLGPRQLLLIEAADGRLEPTLNESPFTARARAVAFAPLHRPHHGVFLASWGRPWADAASIQPILEALARFRASVRPARVLAGLGFALLFAVGPILTLLLGPDAAVLYTAAALYPTTLAAVVWLWWRRRTFALGGGRAALLGIEMLVCPAFLPNLVRKLTASYRIEADGAQVALTLTQGEARAEFLTALERRMQALLEDEDGLDTADRAGLDAYLATVRAAR